jgi:hypothetical protein
MAASPKLQLTPANVRETQHHPDLKQNFPSVVEAQDRGDDDERSGPVDWPELVTRIQRGDDSGMED